MKIEGITAVAAVGDIPLPDLAVITLRSSAVQGALESLSAGKVTAAIVMSVGFSLEEVSALRDLSARTGMAIHGPNCMGIINVHSRTML